MVKALAAYPSVIPLVLALACLAFSVPSCSFTLGTGLPVEGGTQAIYDHLDAQAGPIPALDARRAANGLRVVVFCGESGRQIVNALSGMDAFYGSSGAYAIGDSGLSLDTQDAYLEDPGAGDYAFVATTELYLSSPSHQGTNLVVWTWQDDLSTLSRSAVTAYLTAMAGLESAHPGISFAYATGHADGTGIGGNLDLRNEQIRGYCAGSGRLLLDVYDLECYDPDGRRFSHRRVEEDCSYDGAWANWALEWQRANPTGYWECQAPGGQSSCANQKAKAFWAMIGDLSLDQ